MEDCEETPLHIAARMGHVEFARLMLQLKPEFSAVKDQNGRSPLHVASAHDHAEVAREILRKDGENRMRMDVNRLCLLKDKDGKNPLHMAAPKGSREVAEVILAANPSCLQDVTTKKETVLHLTVNNNNVELLKYFLGREDIRSIVNRLDCNNKSVFDLASDSTNFEITEAVGPIQHLQQAGNPEDTEAQNPPAVPSNEGVTDRSAGNHSKKSFWRRAKHCCWGGK